MDYTSARSPNASFLGIPRELRLQIYDYVCAEEVNYRPITQWQDLFKLKSPNQRFWGFHSQPERDSHARLELTWLNLLLSCKTVRSELDAYMDSLSCRTRDRTPDFELDLYPVGVCGGHLGSATWKSIRRPLTKPGVLVANIDVSRTVRLWGVGGPNPIVRGLYQALNHFLHCGPRMDAQRPLSKPLRLRELVINIEYGNTIARQPANPGGEHPQNFFNHIRKLATTGIISGYVDKITVRSGEWLFEETVDPLTPQNVPDSWDGYGFQWGIEKYRAGPYVVAPDTYN